MAGFKKGKKRVAADHKDDAQPEKKPKYTKIPKKSADELTSGTDKEGNKYWEVGFHTSLCPHC
jgi:hypothetical protein